MDASGTDSYRAVERCRARGQGDVSCMELLEDRFEVITILENQG
jgi:hypothetical protein